MIKLLISIMVMQTALWSEINFDGSRAVNIKEAASNIEIPKVEVRKPSKDVKEWTIMVYLNAKNDLESFGISDMNEMEKVGSTDRFNIVVEMGRIKGYDSSNGDWTGVRRYYITKDNDPETINSKMIQDLGEVDMGDYKELINFAKWAKENYPAKKYLLVIWNHGSGWEKGKRMHITRGISYDFASKNHINTPQLGMAMKEIGGVDLLDFDACLMQMAEVAYEIKDYVPYIVASEETEPGDGNSYDGFLSKLASSQSMGPLELGKAIVDAYYQYYNNGKDGTTKSVIRTEQLPGLLDAVNNFAYAVSQAGDKNIVKNALSKVQTFASEDNRDLYHFAKLISDQTTDSNVKEKATALMSFIKNKLVAYNKTTNGSSWYGTADYSNSYGIAIYIPSSSIASGYSELAWSKYSNWDEFIKWYLGKSEVEKDSSYNLLFGEK